MLDIDHPTTLLVVEDDVLVRMHGADILSDAGFDVIEAGTAHEALALLDQRGEISLVFSDVDMPGGMDGIELARLVHERWPNVRLLLTSGYHNLEPACLPEGGRFVRKPWTHETLVQKIRDVLASSPEQRGPISLPPI